MAPIPTAMTVPADGIYSAGQNLDLTVTFTEVVTVDTTGGTPRIPITLLIGGTVYANYLSGSGTETLTFRFTVAPGEATFDSQGFKGIALGASIDANGGTIHDSANSGAVLSIGPVEPSTANINVFTPGQFDPPSVINSVAIPANGTYVSGQNLDFIVTFAKAVTVITTGGTPSIPITLDTGGTVSANYLSGSGTSTLTFRFTVAPGEQDLNGITLGSSINPNGGIIQDVIGVPAALTLNNVGSTAGIDVDAIIPQADLSVVVTDAAITVVPGTNNPYRITVTNNGPSTVSSVTLTDTIPSALTHPVFGSPSAGSYDSATGQWTGLSLASGQSVSITLTGTIDPNATGSITNTITVSPPAGVTDSNLANNSATDTDTLATLSVVVNGSSAKVGFTVSAIATPDAADAAAIISYQWQSSADSGATWNPISGATGSSYVVQASDGNKLLRVHAFFTDDTSQLITADSIAFNGPVVPDLVVSSISAGVNVNIVAGDTLSFSYLIKNNGPGDDVVSSWAGIFLDNNFATTVNSSTWNLIGPILAGNSVMAINSFSTAGLAIGTHTLTVVADYWNDTTHKVLDGNNDVAESDETNNATTVAFTVVPAAAAALPDLRTIITFPSVSVNQGDAFNFSYEVMNFGSGDVHTASWAGIFLDGATSTVPGGFGYISAMAAGGVATVNTSLSTAGLALGNHTLTVTADYWNDAAGMPSGNNDVAEGNEANNSTPIHFIVDAPVPALAVDLVVDSITPNTASVHQGDNFNFSYVIKDIGAGPVNSASWGGIFLDGQTTTLFGGTSTSGWNHIGPMAAGGSVTALDSFSTAGLSQGDHTLTVKADYWNDAASMANSGNNDITESNESNNATTIHFTVTAPALPDLVVDSITPVATSVALGQSLNLSYVIKDIGAGGVHANSWAGIFLDGQATTLFGGTSPSGWNHIGPMDAGGAVTASNSFSTAGLSLGDHTLTVKADYWNDVAGMPSGNNDVAESNEANNTTSIHFTVTAATLLVQGANANGPVTVAAGQTVEIGSPYSGAVTFAGDTGILRLDDPASFAGTVAGITGQDTLDFPTIDPANVQPPSYDPASGKLHVTDGTNSADIALIGNYMASVFVAGSDGHSGTSVVDPGALGSVQPLATPQHA